MPFNSTRSGFGSKSVGGFGSKSSSGFGSKSGGGFGSKSSGGFGSKSSGGFGSKSGGGFGSKSGSGGFGNKAGGSSRFGSGGSKFGSGSTGGSRFGSGRFGSPGRTGGGFGSNNNDGSGGGFGSSNQNGGWVDEDDPSKRIQEIKAAYHPESPDCRFQFIFYNKAPPTEIGRYAPPRNYNPRLWEQAKKNNPDPLNLVPAQGIGFEDLKKRIQQQDNATQQHQIQLKLIQDKIDEMTKTHEAQTKATITELRRQYASLSHRLLSVMSRIDLQRARDFPLDPEENDFYRKLLNIKRTLAKPAQFQARVTELSSLVRRHQDDLAAYDMKGCSIDANNMQLIHQFLDTQRRGLHHLSTVLRKDIRDVDKVLHGLQDSRNR